MPFKAPGILGIAAEAAEELSEKRTTVSSSHLVEVAYMPATSSMEITFTNGQTYVYEGVDEETYEALISASSVGSFFHANIKEQYSYTLK